MQDICWKNECMIGVWTLSLTWNKPLSLLLYLPKSPLCLPLHGLSLRNNDFCKFWSRVYFFCSRQWTIIRFRAWGFCERPAFSWHWTCDKGGWKEDLQPEGTVSDRAVLRKRKCATRGLENDYPKLSMPTRPKRENAWMITPFSDWILKWNGIGISGGRAMLPNLSFQLALS